MPDLLRYRGRHHVRGAIVFAIFLGVFGLLVLSIFPSLVESAADIDAVIEALPEAFQEGFGAETYTTVEGFVAVELYQFIWVLFLGLYIAYLAGGSIAEAVETGRIQLLLATPLSRIQLVLETYGALFVPIGILNAIVPLFVFGGSIAIRHPLDPFYLGIVHLASIPYLFVCAGIGLVISVSLGRGDLARRASLAVVFVLFLLDRVTAGTDMEWIGTIGPSRYYDPTDILLHETVAIGDAFLLLGTAIVLVITSAEIFSRRDV